MCRMRIFTKCLHTNPDATFYMSWKWLKFLEMLRYWNIGMIECWVEEHFVCITWTMSRETQESSEQLHAEAFYFSIILFLVFMRNSTPVFQGTARVFCPTTQKTRPARG